MTVAYAIDSSKKKRDDELSFYNAVVAAVTNAVKPAAQEHPQYVSLEKQPYAGLFQAPAKLSSHPYFTAPTEVCSIQTDKGTHALRDLANGFVTAIDRASDALGAVVDSFADAGHKLVAAAASVYQDVVAEAAQIEEKRLEDIAKQAQNQTARSAPTVAGDEVSKVSNETVESSTKVEKIDTNADSASNILYVVSTPPVAQSVAVVKPDVNSAQNNTPVTSKASSAAPTSTLVLQAVNNSVSDSGPTGEKLSALSSSGSVEIKTAVNLVASNMQSGVLILESGGETIPLSLVRGTSVSSTVASLSNTHSTLLNTESSVTKTMQDGSHALVGNRTATIDSNRTNKQGTQVSIASNINQSSQEVSLPNSSTSVVKPVVGQMNGSSVSPDITASLGQISPMAAQPRIAKADVTSSRDLTTAVTEANESVTIVAGKGGSQSSSNNSGGQQEQQSSESKIQTADAESADSGRERAILRDADVVAHS